MPHVVIVSDDLATADGLTSALENAAFDIEYVGGVTALWWYLAQVPPPDLLILNHSADLCRRVRLHPDYHSLPVLMVLPNDNTDVIVAALDAGADDIIAIPYTVGELHARTAALIRRSRRRTC